MCIKKLNIFIVSCTIRCGKLHKKLVNFDNIGKVSQYDNNNKCLPSENYKEIGLLVIKFLPDEGCLIECFFCQCFFFKITIVSRMKVTFVLTL